MALTIISLCVSCLALGFSVFVYVKHDKKLKEYQIRSIEEECRLNRMALLRVEKIVEPMFPAGNHIYFRITNVGKAKAMNVRLHSEPKTMVGGDLDMVCLNPGQAERRYVNLSASDDGKYHLTYCWNDGEGHHEEDQWIHFE